MSALCYYFGAELVRKHPDTPIGLLASSWGGTAIQPWMSPAALAQCKAAAPAPTNAELAASADPALSVVGRLALLSHGGAAFPTNGSCLYYSMIFPLLQNPKRILAWYQGETNAGDPVGYQCLMPSMIEDWRQSWASVGSSPTLPFFFVQLSAWPSQDAQTIPVFRVAVENALALPNVGMVVSADLSDPAGAMHPIHPMWKREVGRRAALWADNVVFGNASSPTSGPRLVSAVWDAWDASWGNFHFQYGAGSYVCGTGSKGPFLCGGVRLIFDQPVTTRAFYNAGLAESATGYYSFITGSSAGLDLWADGNVTGGWFQPAVLTSISADGLTVQLNSTWINPARVAPPTVVRYAWHDYPMAMPLVSAITGLPVGPFNATIVLA
jgi:hypothetical protein